LPDPEHYFNFFRKRRSLMLLPTGCVWWHNPTFLGSDMASPKSSVFICSFKDIFLQQSAELADLQKKVGIMTSDCDDPVEAVVEWA
jgi:hypothetical protein